jgi:hypothetical protein
MDDPRDTISDIDAAPNPCLTWHEHLPRRTGMRPAAVIGTLLVSCAGRRTYDEPLHYFPPREGLRPGTAAGHPQTPF